MDALDRFLNAHGHMRKVNATGYRGPCRACNTSDKSVALSISEGQTGALLVKCFAGGCDVEAIAASVGLLLQDLFPPKLSGHHVPAPKRRGLLTANEALDLLAFEAELTTVAAANLSSGAHLSDQDRARLLQACARITSIYAEVRG